jgi:hypothetical protein
MSSSDIQKFHKLKRGDMFYKVVLMENDGIQDLSAANLSRYSFRLNTNIEAFKGLCIIKTEQIIVDQYTGVANQGQLFFRLNPNQPYSSDASKKMNSSNLLGIVPVTAAATTTYEFNPSDSEIIASLDSVLDVSITDKDGANISSATYTDFFITLRIYPLRDIPEKQ